MKIILSLIITIFFLSANVHGQHISLSGYVADQSNKAIVGAIVSLEKTSFNTTTDQAGYFSLQNIPEGNYFLQISALGFKPQSHNIDVKSNEAVSFRFSMEEKIELLHEVKVLGIRSITGMGYLGEIHNDVIYSGKKTEVLLLDSLDANTAQNNPRQILGRVPGANYSETEASGFPSNGIGFRGLNPMQSIETNTRQNGYNITADLYGYPESYYLPPLEAVARIEVTRGAASLQFGPQFGGVINYVMKRGAVSNPLEINIQQTGGSFGLFNSFSSVGGQKGKFNYYGFVQVQTNQGWRPNSEYKKFTGYAHVDYQLTDKIKIGAEYSMLRNRIHMPGGFTDNMFYTNHRASYRARNWLQSPWNIFALTFDWKISSNSLLTIKSAFNSSARDLVWRNEDGGPKELDGIDPATNQFSPREVEQERFNSNTTEIRFLTNYKLGNATHSLVTGGRIFIGKTKRQEGRTGTTGIDFDLSVSGSYEKDLNFTTTNFAPFVENTFHVKQRLSVTPGFRWEYINSTIKGYSLSDDEMSFVYSNRSRNRFIPLAGLGLQFTTSASTNVYANWSQAYRPFDYSALTPLGTIITVDPNLKDSNGFNSDIGFRGSVKNFLNFDVGYFYLQYNNRVGVIEKTDAQGNQYPYRTNVANSLHQGIESYIEINPIKAWWDDRMWSLSFFNSLALIQAKYTAGEFNGKYVEYAPTHINRLGVNFKYQNFSTTFLISNTAKSFGDASNQVAGSADGVAGLIPSYTILDWSGTWKIKNYNVKLGVNNLSDTRYFTLRTGEYPGPGIIPGIGRSIYFGIGVKI